MKRSLIIHAVFYLVFIGCAFLCLSSCAGGKSNSTPVVDDTPSSPAASVLAVSAVAGDRTATIGWSGITGATSYMLYRSLVSGETGTQIATISSPATSYTDTKLSNGTTYYYVVDAIDGSDSIVQSSQVSATPNPTNSQAAITGSVQYQDKIYGADGFTGDEPYKLVRHASVDIVSAETGKVLASGATDSNGVYSIATVPGPEVYVRVHAEASPGSISPQIQVKNLSGDIYAVSGNNFILSGPANVNISVTTTSPAGGAFNILDVFTNGLEFVYALDGNYPPGLTGYWEEDNQNGTYYCTGCSTGDGIYVYNDPSGDTDGYDDDVLYHEFGHFIADQFSKDDSPGGYHYLTDNDLDMRLTWSEGWGDFFPGAIKSSLSPELLSAAQENPSSMYVDTSGSSGWSFDMGNPVPPSGYPFDSFMYSTNEAAIAKILLDINSNFGMQSIWDVVADFKTNLPSDPVNLELFWDRWHSLGKPTSSGSTDIESIFAERSVIYAATFGNDTFEAATHIESSPDFPIMSTAAHTLYPNGAADYFCFTPQSGENYVITTMDLTNGADTYVEIYSPTDTLIASNDNRNTSTPYSGDVVPSDRFQSLCETAYGPCHENGLYNGSGVLSSKVSFEAESSDPHYIKIYSSSTKPVSAGRYGSYRVSVTLQ